MSLHSDQSCVAHHLVSTSDGPRCICGEPMSPQRWPSHLAYYRCEDRDRFEVTGYGASAQRSDFERAEPLTRAELEAVPVAGRADVTIEEGWRWTCRS